MRAEHCSRADSHENFSPDNYDTITTPAQEYKVVMDSEEGKRVSVGDRRVLPCEELMEHEMAKKSELVKVELRGLVLYTGAHPCPRAPLLSVNRLLVFQIVRSLARSPYSLKLLAST